MKLFLFRQKKYHLIALAIFLAVFNLLAIVLVLDQQKNSNQPSLYYYGVGAPGLSLDKISALTAERKKIGSLIETIVSPHDQVFYLAYPATKANVTKIIDPNGFNLINDFMVRDENIIISANELVRYRIYEFKNITTLESYRVKYFFD